MKSESWYSFKSVTWLFILICLMTTSNAVLSQAHPDKIDSIKRVQTREQRLAGMWICYIPPQPSFPGGHRAWQVYLKESIKWPEIQESIEGNIFLSFQIIATGKVTDITVIRGIHPKLDAEAIRIMSLSPKWQPAIENGNPSTGRVVS